MKVSTLSYSKQAHLSAGHGRHHHRLGPARPSTSHQSPTSGQQRYAHVASAARGGRRRLVEPVMDTFTGTDTFTDTDMMSGGTFDNSGTGEQCLWRITPPTPPEGYKVLLSYTGTTMTSWDSFRIFDAVLPANVRVHATEFAGGMTPWVFIDDQISEAISPIYGSSSHATEVVITSGSAILAYDASYDSDGYLPSFNLEWKLQPLQPPNRPDPPQPVSGSATLQSVLVRWTAPTSAVPVMQYVLQYWADDVARSSLVLDAPTVSVTLLQLRAGLTYMMRVQAWTEDEDTDTCVDGSNHRCSLWSDVGNVTIEATATVWYVAHNGSYLYGEGSMTRPFAADLQGVFERSHVETGHEVVLLPGYYGALHMFGTGRAQDLNMQGKFLTLRSASADLAGARETIIDCAGTSHFMTFNHSEPASVSVIGLTVRNCSGETDGRGAVFINAASPTFKSVIFENNYAERGGAVVAQGHGSPSFEWCSFVNNSASSGCPESCSLAKRSDSTCDSNLCGSRQCGWDYKGSCCPQHCGLSWGDGTCDAACHVAECGWDGGDCCDAVGCIFKAGDGTCDDECNNADCGFDAGDCSIDVSLSYGGYELAEHVGFDGFSKGGDAALIGGASGTFTSCTFENSAADLGGSFYVQGCRSSRATDAPCTNVPLGGTSVLTLVDCNVTGTAALRGGFAYVAVGGTATLTNVRSAGTSAEEQGGLVWASQARVTVLGGEASEFSSVDGAALYLSDTTLFLEGFDFHGMGVPTTATGGAVVLTDGSHGHMTNCTISNSTSTFGAGIRLVSTDLASSGSGRLDTYSVAAASTLDMNGCTLRDNNATLSGGAIQIVGSTTRNSVATLQWITLRSNRAGVTGGGIAMDKGDVTISRSSILSSDAVRGGGVHAASSQLQVENTDILNGHASLRGGGIDATGGGFNLAAGTTLSGNTAGVSGGGAVLDGVSDAIIDDVTIRSSVAPTGGGVQVQTKNHSPNLNSRPQPSLQAPAMTPA